jgi:hypothetical protein
MNDFINMSMKQIEYSKNLIESEKKHYDIVMLVIASYNYKYSNMIDIWKKYIKKFDNIKIYLLFCRNDIDEQVYIDEDESAIFYNCEESFIPGIFLKSIHSIDFCHRNFTYDYLIRTNISSFYNIPKLIDFLNDQPKNNFAGGCCNTSYNIPFISGSGMIISYDLIDKILISAFNQKSINHIFNLPDDVLLSYLINLHINPDTYIHIKMFDIHEKITSEKIKLLTEDDYFHYRNRNDEDNRILDSYNLELLVRYFY